MSTQDEDRDYEVGYGKPPKTTRFKPGRSGNPNGRPPRSRNLNTILQETLMRPVQIRDGGKRRTVSQLEAFIMLVTKTALSGDGPAANRMIRMLPMLMSAVEREAQQAQADGDEANALAVTQTDRNVLEYFAGMIRNGDLTFEAEQDK